MISRGSRDCMKEELTMRYEMMTLYDNDNSYVRILQESVNNASKMSAKNGGQERSRQ